MGDVNDMDFFQGLFDDRELVREELLVFRAVKLLMSPLLERDVSTEKENKPAEELSCVCIYFYPFSTSMTLHRFL